MQSVGRRLSVHHIVRTNDRIEPKIGGEASQRNIRLITKTPRKNRQFIAADQSIEQPRLGKPPLPLNQPIAILAQKPLIERTHYLAVFNFSAEIRGNFL